MLQRVVGVVLVLFVAGACGGTASPSAVPEPAAASDEPDARPPVEADELTEMDSEEEAVALDSTEEEAEPPPALEVRYHVASDGLRVVVAGIEFEPRAKAVRVGNGWGVKIDVKARAQDGAPHVLYKPEQGPLAFFAAVDRGGKKEEQGDQRRGEGEEYVTQEGIEFSRTWPGDMGMKPLAQGQTLELQVGLWGVGKSMTSHRPLKRFFTVKMVGGNRPQAVVSPPSSAQ